MPELPELQAHAERLTDEFGGRELNGLPRHRLHRAQDLRAVPRRGRRPPAELGRSPGQVPAGRHSARSPSWSTSCRAGGSSPTTSSRSSLGAASPAGSFADGSALLLTEAGTEKRAGVWVRDPEADGGLEAQEPLAGLRTRRRHRRRGHHDRHLRRPLDAPARPAARPAGPGRGRTPPGQRDLPSGPAVPVRQRGQARRRPRSASWSTPCTPASPSRWPTSAPATT